MRRWIVGALVAAALALAGFMAMKLLTPPPADLDLSRSGLTANGLYAVAIEPEAEPVEQGTLHAWIATITLPDGAPVADAVIAVGGGMPQHGHGLPTAPQATLHLGEGRYRIEGVRFNMGGWWQLSLAISAAQGDDPITFNIVL